VMDTNGPLTGAFARGIATYLQRGETARLEEVSADLDPHPLFASFTGEERRWFRRLVQQEPLRRSDSMVSRWLRIGGRVDYDENFYAVLRGTPLLGPLVATALMPD
jgi:hypothetical protein